MYWDMLKLYSKPWALKDEAVICHIYYVFCGERVGRELRLSPRLSFRLQIGDGTRRGLLDVLGARAPTGSHPLGLFVRLQPPWPPPWRTIHWVQLIHRNVLIQFHVYFVGLSRFWGYSLQNQTMKPDQDLFGKVTIAFHISRIHIDILGRQPLWLVALVG